MKILFLTPLFLFSIFTLSAASWTPAPTRPSLTAEQYQARLVLGAAIKSYHANDLAGAVQACKEALRLDPSFASAAELMAWCAWDRGDPRDAAESLRVAVQLKPDDVGLVLWLVRIHAGQKEWREASEILQAAKARLGGNPSLLREEAGVLVAMGRLEEAKAVLAGLQHENGESDDLRLLLAEVYEKSGEFEAAANEVRALLNEDHDTSLVLRLAHLFAAHGSRRGSRGVSGSGGSSRPQERGPAPDPHSDLSGPSHQSRSTGSARDSAA